MVIDPVNVSPELVTKVSEVVPTEEPKQSVFAGFVSRCRSFISLTRLYQASIAQIVKQVASRWGEGIREEAERSRQDEHQHRNKKNEIRRDQIRQELVKEEVRRQEVRLYGRSSLPSKGGRR